MKKDAAIGLVFPLFFSIGVILISQYARNTHLDVDMVLLGELAFAPFNRMVLNDIDYGPYAVWTMGAVVFINICVLSMVYKELLVATFDESLARIMGISSVTLYYILMIITSITAVAAFDVVGSIMVVALMTTPPASAYLLVGRTHTMIFTSVCISIVATLCGYGCALYYDVSIAGSIATMTGIFFLIAFMVSLFKNSLNKSAI